MGDEPQTPVETLKSEAYDCIKVIEMRTEEINITRKRLNELNDKINELESTTPPPPPSETPPA